MGDRAGNASSNFLGVPQGDFYRGGRIGRYEILTQLSVGGMAELFLAFTNGPGGFRKFVVVKRILPDARANENAVKMFFDEARITAALNHPNIAAVFDLGDSDGPYLAMEFIAGQNLNQVTAACLKRRRPLPVGFSVAVTRDVCLALHHAHTFVDQAGSPFPVIHRDVAQKNVMVSYDGVTKLLDFGIAKSRGSLGRTNAGMVKGTTGYMSPEQVRGEQLDGRSDLFSAGVMLHELLTGRRLFAADTEAEEMERILAAPIPRPSALEPSIPESISDVVMQALARNRAERFPSGRVMARALEKAAGRLLFGQDELAAFMRELFESKMSATRALLESAGAEDQSPIAQSAVSTLTEDTGMTFPEGGGAQEPRRPVATDPAALPVALPEPPARMSSFWIIGIAGALVLACILLYLAMSGMQAASQPRDAEDGAGTSAIPVPAGARPDARVHEGTLTLITFPESEVFTSGQNSLGRTPLLGVTLPVGTHHMRLKASDGVGRLLVVEIQPGQNTSLRLKLNDLPLAE